MMDSGTIGGIAAISITASGMVSGAIWRLATKIERLTVTSEASREACEKTHTALNADRADEMDWIRSIQGKLNDHCEDFILHSPGRKGGI
jgi:hypothetical protein